MKKQKNVHLELMKFPKDKFEIAQWQRDYPDTEGFKNIRKYILEDNIYTNLMEVIELNHETFAIGEEEQKLALVAKLDDETIIAWILLDIFNLDTPEPGIFLQYICMHPLYQNKGYGTQIGKELFLSTEKYLSIKPSYIFSYIEKTNLASQKLYKKFNFKLSECSENFLRATTTQPKLISNSDPKALGE